MHGGDIAKAAITAHLAGDDEAVGELISDLDVTGLCQVAGTLLAYVGNVVKLIARAWEVSDSEAWAMILQAEREVEAA